MVGVVKGNHDHDADAGGYLISRDETPATQPQDPKPPAAGSSLADNTVLVTHLTCAT